MICFHVLVATGGAMGQHEAIGGSRARRLVGALGRHEVEEARWSRAWDLVQSSSRDIRSDGEAGTGAREPAGDGDRRAVGTPAGGADQGAVRN
jgi:hypothetical protein